MMKKHTQVDDNLLVKYLLNETTAAERRLVENWAHVEPGNARRLEQTKKILYDSELTVDDNLDAQAALLRLNSRLENRGHLARSIGKRWQLAAFRAAAAVLLLTGLGWLAYITIMNNTEVNVRATASTLTDTLPDGTFATLNKNSSLLYPRRFSGGTRSVSLRGEAFFRVVPDKTRPFVIVVNDVRVEVLGTSFNVRSRNGKTTVTVASGRVAVSRNQQTVLLSAGERTTAAAGQASLKKIRSAENLYSYYVDGKIVCDQTPLAVLLPVLNQKFNTTIVLGRPELNKLRISTTFRHETLAETLDILAQTFGLRVEYQDTQIILK